MYKLENLSRISNNLKDAAVVGTPIPQRQFSFPRSAPEIHAGVFDKRGLSEQLFQGGAFFFREPLIFELERLAEYLCKLLHPVPRRCSAMTFGRDVEEP